MCQPVRMPYFSHPAVARSFLWWWSLPLSHHGLDGVLALYHLLIVVLCFCAFATLSFIQDLFSVLSPLFCCIYIFYSIHAVVAIHSELDVMSIGPVPCESQLVEDTFRLAYREPCVFVNADLGDHCYEPSHFISGLATNLSYSSRLKKLISVSFSKPRSAKILESSLRIHSS